MSLFGECIHITGIVQGVGFRPFVYSLALRMGLKGWVRNTSAGVDIQVDGSVEQIQVFIHALKNETPPLAQIDSFESHACAPGGYTHFEIIHSEAIPEAFQPISPDVSICDDCLRELFNPQDRRYRYPFINCTNCGPRFTIIEDIPYDRPKTTMSGFPLCQECLIEYTTPQNRRFHAQPVACARCGPQVWLELNLAPGGKNDELKDRIGEFRFDHSEATLDDKDAQPTSLPVHPSGDEAIFGAQRLLIQGKIIAVKGLGGFHLACDATNEEAVSELRRRKLRVDKPFALMMPDLVTIEEHCMVNQAERELLESRARPVVILRRRPGKTIAPQVAPHQDTLGVMLPYTPLHYLLLTQIANTDLTGSSPNPGTGSSLASLPALVMTSGNMSEEPIAFSNQAAREHLSTLVDAFLMHNRPIRTRCDDSVMRVAELGWFRRKKSIHTGIENRDSTQSTLDLKQSTILPLRRSRGYAPFPVQLPWETPPLLATGAELKNTFCITHKRYAFLSQHIGDLENYETLASFEDGIHHFESLFRVKPQVIAYDLHPNYLATRYALERAEEEQLPSLGVQHHHAHIAACMAENGLQFDHPIIGVAFDGTGYGDDGAIWGGEFLLADYLTYQRIAHLAYVPLPGGDKAVREPWRIALTWLAHANIEWSDNLPPVIHATHLPHLAQRAALLALTHQIETGINSPNTSSIGRLFDAVAALSGVRQIVNYEAQAAIEFEALVDPQEMRGYSFEINRLPNNIQAIDPSRLFEEIVSDLNSGIARSTIAARFHNGVAEMVRQVVINVRTEFGVNEVILSGGVWQNITLLRKTISRLQKENFYIYIHSQVPTNDGGLALGQAAIARRNLCV